jgi:murein DD-endopeptidase MepM/ murein hydrolase activator NlpD
MPPVSREYMAMTTAGGGRGSSPHTGIDIRVPNGHDVLAAADGGIAFAQQTQLGGLGIGIDHGADEEGRTVRMVSRIR